ncbi:MAG TPA: glycosyltransferase family 39 protein [Herpetosiphonaceae bacterium]
MRSPLSSPPPTFFTALQQRYIAFAPLVACGGLALLLVAQTQLQRQQLTIAVIGALGLGCAAWLLALCMASPAPDHLGAIVEQRPMARWYLLSIAALLALLAWLESGGGTYTLINVGAWTVAVAAWCRAWWPVTPADERQERPTGRSRLVVWLALGAILAVGALFRFYRLSEVPADPTSDHAEKLLDILNLVNGQRPIFFPRNTGREPGQFYLTYGLMRLFDLPLAFETLKLGTALIGLLAIPAVFLLAREVAGTTAGLLAAALFAISKWVVNIARMGLRFPYGPLPTAIVLWLLLRYLRRGDRRDALWCGLAIGLGLHGYISFRIVPLLVPLLLGLALLTDRRWREQWRRLVIDGALIAATALLSCLPLARYTVQHPDQVWYRVATRAAGAERELGAGEDLLTTFARNTWKALLAFNWHGDSTVVNAVQYDPFLDPVSGAALLAGLLLIGYQIAVRRAPRFGALVVALPVLLLPSTLNLAFPIENPSANRLGTVAPLIFTIAALPLAHIAGLLWTNAPSGSRTYHALRRAAAIGLLGGGLALATQHNYVRYFYDYDRQYRASVQNTHEIARHLREVQASQGIALDQTYLLAFPHWLDGRNLALVLGDLNWQTKHDLPAEVALPRRSKDQPLLFVLHPDDLARRQELQAAYPEGSYRVVAAAPPAKNFAIYVVPGR